MWFYRSMELALLCGGGDLLILALRNFYRGSAARNWTPTPGKILRSFVLVEEGSEGGESYRPKVEYEYTYRGLVYRGDRLRFGQTVHWNRKQAEHIIAPFQEGSTVPLYVDPAKPKDAVLIRGTSMGNLAIAAAGLILAWVGYLFHIHAH